MKYIALAAGAALFAFTSPAIAKSDKAQGHGKHGVSAMTHNGHGKMKARGMGKTKVGYYGFGKGGCPPGLRKKNDMCMPRGQYKKLYSQGQRYPGNYGSLWNYNQIPVDLRSQYNLDRSNRYYYGDGYLYQVDPRTRLIEQVVNAIVR